MPSPSRPLSIARRLRFAGLICSPRSIFLPQSENVQFKLYDPKSNEVSMQANEHIGDFPLGDSGLMIPATTYWFDKPAVGLWTLVGECASLTHVSAKPFDLVILLWNSDGIQVR